MKRRANANASPNASGTEKEGQPKPNPRTGEFDTIDNKKPVERAGEGVEMKDINLKVEGEDSKQEGIGPGPDTKPNPRGKDPKARDLPKQQEDEDEAVDYDGYDDESLPLWNQMVNRYPKSIDWLFMVVTFCAMRAAIPAAIAFAYLTLIAKAVQIIGKVVDKPIVSYIGYGAYIVFLLILFFIAMAYE